MLTIEDLQPGKLYRVTDPGNADPAFRGAIVLACRTPTQQHRAVTVAFANGYRDTHWIGAPWWDLDTAPEEEDEDSDARFEPVETVILVSYP